MNLYSILGVARGATLDLVKRAFRQKVKVHHPDAGGSPEVFAQLKLAYDVLSDEERRQRYDETGEVHDTSMASHLHSVAMAVLSRLVLEMITGQEDPSSLDLKAVGRQRLTRDINKMREQLHAYDEAILRAKKLQGLWSSEGGENVMDSLVNTQFLELQRNKTNVEGQIAAYQLAVNILETHNFKPKANQNMYVYERPYYGYAR